MICCSFILSISVELKVLVHSVHDIQIFNSILLCFLKFSDGVDIEHIVNIEVFCQ